MTSVDAAKRRLKQAPWLQSPEVQQVFSLLDGTSNKTRVVGGIVRDSLLGMLGDRIEIDFASELTPDEVTRRGQKAGISVIPTGIEFGTVTLVINGQNFEVTTLRRDVETDGRWAKVSFGNDWREDAARRDFTMNALYCGPDGELFDPLEGLGDCLAHRVKFIGDARTRINEDKLRVFRFFRFSASHGNHILDPEGLGAVEGAVTTLGDLSAERIGSEMVRMLALPKVYSTLDVMTRVGVLDWSDKVLDELRRCDELDASIPAEVRLAVVSKVNNIKSLQSIWRLSNACVSSVKKMCAAANFVEMDALNEAAFRYPEYLHEGTILVAINRDEKASWIAEKRAELDKIFPKPLPIGGKDLARLGMKPGPKMGQVLSHLEKRWIESDFSLSQDALIAHIPEEFLT